MYQYWKKKSQEEIKKTIFGALDKNVNYDNQAILGIPASYLDGQVFNKDATFVQDATYNSTLLQNPNHIGCHTLGKSESFFSGTQQIEREVIALCATDILHATEEVDGYIASGGTESNMQAIWIYRNYFIQKEGASLDEIVIICSEDSHYSMDKASNVFCLDIVKVAVEKDTRELRSERVIEALESALAKGKKYFIVVSNMMTTMFGSVDKVKVYTDALNQLNCHYRLHVDGSYGGFYYPFTTSSELLTFKNPHIHSFTLDAHKMAQAPYGTGIFLIRKGYMKFTNTREAKYVAGEDYTLIGSRSGANAVAVWMILIKNGPYGWHEKVFILQKRADWLCEQLNKKKIGFYRHPKSNIITIRSSNIPKEVATKYGLVPDNHDQPNWYKIVLMEHVIVEKLVALMEDIESFQVSACVCNNCANNCKKDKVDKQPLQHPH